MNLEDIFRGIWIAETTAWPTSAQVQAWKNSGIAEPWAYVQKVLINPAREAQQKALNDKQNEIVAKDNQLSAKQTEVNTLQEKIRVLEANAGTGNPVDKKIADAVRTLATALKS